MESQPQNPEFRNNPENFHPFIMFRDIGNPIYFMKSNIKSKWQFYSTAVSCPYQIMH